MSENEQRNEKRETVADIVAQIRAAAYIQNADTPESVLRLADRIETAWKRERAKVEADALAVGGIVETARTAEKSSAVGNVAAMREALLNIQEYAAAMDVDDGNVLAILDACRDALSAPARNCDRFGGDYKILHTAWFDWTGSPRGHLPDGTAKLTFARWLLEMAETMKGDDNGSK